MKEAVENLIRSTELIFNFLRLISNVVELFIGFDKWVGFQLFLVRRSLEGF